MAKPIKQKQYDRDMREELDTSRPDPYYHLRMISDGRAVIHIRDEFGKTRPARFPTMAGAMEACRVIYALTGQQVVVAEGRQDD